MKRLSIFSIIVLFSAVSILLGGAIQYDVLYKTRTPVGITEKEITDIVDNALQWEKSGNPYSKARIKVFAENGPLDHLVVYMLRADIYLAEIYKIEMGRNNSYRVIEDYTEEVAPPDDGICQTCPDETIEIVVSTSESSSSHPANEYTKKCYEMLDNAGIKTVALYGNDENLTAIQNWLSCKNLKLWGRIGHGASNGDIILGSGSLRPSNVAQMDLHHKFMIINSCYVHNQAMIPSMIDKADAYFFCSGNNVSLPMYTSEPVWKAIIEKGVLEDMEFGAAVTEAGQEGNMTKYGYTRNPDAPNNECFWKDVSALMLGLDSPNGGNVYVVGTSVDITWTTNADTKISLFLLKGTSVLDPIVENTENDGLYTWTIPEDTDEGSDYKIRAETDTLVDESDAAFTIKKKPAIVCKTDLIAAALDTTGTSLDKELKIKNDGEGTLAYKAAVGGAGGIMINEIYIGYSEPDDGFELWNRGPDQDMTGWKLKWNDDAQSSGEYEFESGYVFKSNEIIVCNDVSGSDFYVGDLKWEESTELSIALTDASGNGVDFVRTAGNNDQPPSGTTWNGDGVANGEAYVYRTQNEDTDSKEGWSVGTSGTIGALNPGQTISRRADHWLVVAPEEGTVAPKQETAVTLTFNSEGLEIGDYYDTVFVTHDDPDKDSPIAVPCKLTIAEGTGITLMIGNTITTFGISCRGSRIAYQVPISADGKPVTLKLYNLKGELVHILAQGNHRTGTYLVSLTTRNNKVPAAGNYICHMEAKGFTKAINVLVK